MNVSGSSPPGSRTTFTSKPASTSSSLDRSAAFWPAVSGSKLMITLGAKRRSICACWVVSAVPHVATTGSPPAWKSCAKSK